MMNLFHALDDKYIITIQYLFKSITLYVHHSPPHAVVSTYTIFSQTLSDNYPERLRRLVLYPFPWMAAAVWSLVRLFIDPKTRDKVVLLSGDESHVMAELDKNYMDLDRIPECCWGRSKEPVLDVLTLVPE